MKKTTASFEVDRQLLKEAKIFSVQNDASFSEICRQALVQFMANGVVGPRIGPYVTSNRLNKMTTNGVENNGTTFNH